MIILMKKNVKLAFVFLQYLPHSSSNEKHIQLEKIYRYFTINIILKIERVDPCDMIHKSVNGEPQNKFKRHTIEKFRVFPIFLKFQ